jgi:membrane-bound metal-dependent hydrolase YbcI (DUF457 family)
MPFTPFHMGPGMLIKALLQGSFSLMVFGWAQILIDIQPLVAIITSKGQLHGFSHTYIGASLIAIAAAVTGKHLSEFGLVVLGIHKKEDKFSIAWWVVFISAFIGTYTHVALDSIMHSDLQPFYPFGLTNDLLGLIGISTLYELCLKTGLLGAAIYYSVRYINRRLKG